MGLAEGAYGPIGKVGGGVARTMVSVNDSRLAGPAPTVEFGGRRLEAAVRLGFRKRKL